MTGSRSSRPGRGCANSGRCRWAPVEASCSGLKELPGGENLGKLGELPFNTAPGLLQCRPPRRRGHLAAAAPDSVSLAEVRAAIGRFFVEAPAVEPLVRRAGCRRRVRAARVLWNGATGKGLEMKNARITFTKAVLSLLAAALWAPAIVHAASNKPNILVIWGDDIGIDNISAYNLGMMGYHTPNIDRIAKEGALFTDSYAQQSCTAGRASFILGAASVPHRAADHRHAGLAAGHPRLGADDRRPAEGAGLRDRPVRQEPPRRPRPAPADGARLRRVPRQPLPPERRGGAGDLLLSEGSGVQEEVRSARRAAHVVATARAGRRSRTPVR